MIKCHLIEQRGEERRGEERRGEGGIGDKGKKIFGEYLDPHTIGSRNDGGGEERRGKKHLENIWIPIL